MARLSRLSPSAATPAVARATRIVDLRTSRGVRRAMLFSKAILNAEFEANAPLGEAMAIKGAR
jgi:hypothetical protein